MSLHDIPPGGPYAPEMPQKCMDQIHDHPSPLSDLVTILHKPQSSKSKTCPQVALPHPPGPQNGGSNDPSTPLIGAGTSGGSNNLPVDLLGTGANRGTNIPPMDHPMDTTDKTGVPHINLEDTPLYEDPPSA
ncbi:hypothetical protein BDQ17DRAFT_1437318 [Cyathus striatus]|nr:hypothetical protein BDQ17DRAFT_1437318 [Cyathus striatus]